MRSLDVQNETEGGALGERLIDQVGSFGEGVEVVSVAGVPLFGGRLVVTGDLEVDEGGLLPECADEAHRGDGGGGEAQAAMIGWAAH